jgi:hypothetical protein
MTVWAAALLSEDELKIRALLLAHHAVFDIDPLNEWNDRDRGAHTGRFAPTAVARLPFLRRSAGQQDRAARHLTVSAKRRLRLLPLVLLGCAPYIDCK